MAEEDRRTTPYSYTFDDPIRHTDPDGMFGEDANDNNGGDGECCKTAKIIFGTGLVVGGSIIVGAAPTGPGEVVAVPVAAVTVLTTTIVSGFALIYDALTDNSGKSSAPEPAPIVQARDNNREGKDFTPKGKKTVIDDNKAKNNGKTVCEGCKVETTKPEQSKKGVTPPTTDTQVDHKKAKSKGGKGTPDNGQVLCRGCNIKKSDKDPTPPKP